MSACKKSVAWWWLCMMALSLPIDTQQQSQEDTYEKCYNLTTTRHCFKTDRGELLKSFAGASSWCKSQGYFLVTIKNSDVQAIVEQFLMEFELTSDDVWIAAKRPTEGQWTWVNGDVYDDVNSLPTADENMTNAAVAYLATVHPASTTYRLIADSYRTTERYICKFSGSTCDRYAQYANTKGYFDGGSGTCYVTFPKHNQRAKNNWFMARNKCLMEGGDLADEGAINLSLPLNLDPRNKAKYLVGLRRDEFVWIESDQPVTPVRSTRFLSSEPSEEITSSTSSNAKNCVSLSYISQWGWVTRDCTESVLFVCEKVEARTDLPPCSTVWPTGSTTVTGGGNDGNCWSDDKNLLIGIIVGCVLFYIISILLVVIIMACCCRSREDSGGPGGQGPIVAYRNDHDYMERSTPHNIYNDVRK